MSATRVFSFLAPLLVTVCPALSGQDAAGPMPPRRPSQGIAGEAPEPAGPPAPKADPLLELERRGSGTASGVPLAAGRWGRAEVGLGFRIAPEPGFDLRVAW